MRIPRRRFLDAQTPGHSICLVSVPGGLAEPAAAPRTLGRLLVGRWIVEPPLSERWVLQKCPREGGMSIEIGLTLVLKCFQMPFMVMASPRLHNSSGRWAALPSILQMRERIREDQWLGTVSGTGLSLGCRVDAHYRCRVLLSGLPFVVTPPPGSLP